MCAMHRCALVCVLLALPAAAAPEAQPASAAPVPTGLLPLDPVRVPGDALLLLQNDLQQRLETRADVSVLSQMEMLLHLQAVRALGLSCDRESTECIKRIGALAGVEQVVRGVAERRRAVSTGYEALLRLWLHDANDGRVLGYVYAFLPGDPDVRQAAIDDAFARLFTPEEHGGALYVASEVDGAEVWIDSMLVGETPLAVPLRGVLPGEHVVDVKKAGHVPLRSRPTIGAGEAAEIYAVLPPEENEAPVPVVTPPEPLRVGFIATNMGFVGGALMVLGGIAVLYGAIDNLGRNGERELVLEAARRYEAGDADITEANTASVVARGQSAIEGSTIPYVVGMSGGILAGFGLLMVTGSATLFALGAE
jgi:hypothetical protein